MQPGTLRATEARAVARFVGVQCELLGDKGEPLGEGCDRKEREGEYHAVRPAVLARQHGERRAEHQQVQVVGEEQRV